MSFQPGQSVVYYYLMLCRCSTTGRKTLNGEKPDEKLTAALCVVLLMICVFVPGAAAAGPALGATRAYCIIDADTGLVLAQQNMNEELHPASITKVMTLGLACEKAQGNWMI